jgi:hypothetical protein
MLQLLRRRTRPPDLAEERSKAEDVLSAAGANRELAWCGGFICIVFALGILAFIASSRLHAGGALPASATEQSTGISEARGERTSCLEIGDSDLRSPVEGLWFENNCLAVAEAALVPTSTLCNGTSLPAGEFTEVSPGLYVFRQTRTAAAYLWYSSSDTCFDLVSARVVTAVCADQTVSFSWEASACSAHGGVLAWVNGPGGQRRTHLPSP